MIKTLNKNYFLSSEMLGSTYCFCLLLFLSFSTSAQIVTVLDSESRLPLEMVTLATKDNSTFAFTDAKGQADVTDMKGAEVIELRLVGFETFHTSYEMLKASSFSIALVRSQFSLDQIVISASRWGEKKKYSHSKVSTIGAKQIELQNPQTAADLLSISGEVFIQKSQQGGGSPMIRGFSTNRLLLVVDGVRMNNAIFRSGNLQNVISIDPMAVATTEVLFGPGSVMYGSDAIGGVMRFQTLTPKFSLAHTPEVTGRAMARYSSANNEKTGHFDINLGWQKWATVTSISGNDFDDLRMGEHGPDDYLRPFYVERVGGNDIVVDNDDSRLQVPTAYRQTNLMQKVRFRPNQKWDLTYGLHYSTTSDYARYDRHIRTRNGLPRSGEWSYGPQVWVMNHFKVLYTSSSKLFNQVRLDLAYQRFEESRMDRDFNDVVRRVRKEEVDAYSVNIDLRKSFNIRQIISYGAELVLNDVGSTGIDENIVDGSRVRGPSRYPAANWASLGAYVNYKHRFSEKILAQSGVRYSHFILDATFDTAFYPLPFQEVSISNGATTGSIGVVYTSGKWTISSNISTAFRAPNVDDVGKVFDSEPGSVVVPNPDLEAEYAYNVDLSLAKTFGKYVKADLTAFYTILNNAMVRRDFVLNGRDSIIYADELSQVQAIQNAAVANVYGLQAGIEVTLPRGFGILSRLNYQKGEEELDNGTVSASRHAPPMFGITRLTYTRNKVKIDLYAMYSGEVNYKNLAVEERSKAYLYAKDNNGNPYSPSWYTLNLKAQYQILDKLTVNAGVENITDQRYRPYSSGLAAAGRNLIMSILLNF